MKKLISFILALLLVCSLSGAALAEEAQLGYITDDSGVLDDAQQALLEETARISSEKYQCGLYFAAVTDYTELGEGDIQDVAEQIFESYYLGYGPEKDGVLLLVSTDDGNCGMVAQGRANKALVGQLQELLDEAVDGYAEGGYAGIAGVYLTRMDALLAESFPDRGPDAEPAPYTPPVEFLSCDLGDVDYVTDLYGLVTPEQELALERKAAEISERFGCGVYIIVLDDFTRYGYGDMYTTAGDIYLATELGLGEDRTGLLLIMSMADRDVALISYGAANRAVNAEGKDWLAPKYLKHFRSSDWYTGLDAYLENSITLMEMAAKGRPMTALTTPEARILGAAVSLLLGFAVAGLIMGTVESKMKSVFKARTAGEYIVPGGVHFTNRQDIFAGRTENRRRIERSSGGSGRSGGSGFSSGGSRSVDSRGFSGRTDKF